MENASGEFGYSKSNPIPVCGQQGQLDYLSKLRCDCDEPFAFHRIGSFGIGADGHMIDGYELVCRKRVHRFVLYMDMYREGPTCLCPPGMASGPTEGVGLPFCVEDSPDGLAEAFENFFGRP